MFRFTDPPDRPRRCPGRAALGAAVKTRGLAGAVLLGLALAGSARAADLAPGAGPPPAGPGLSTSLLTWPEGPVRWLLVPAELRRYRALRRDDDAYAFIRDFWNRRDDRPETPANELADQISARIDMADRLYGEEGTRGSLTDRGGAFLLLGSPSFLRSSRRRLPGWSGATGAGAGAGRGVGAAPASRTVEVEEWGYAPEELPPRLLELAPSLAREERVILVFHHGEKRTALVDGKAILGLAARALVRVEAP